MTTLTLLAAAVTTPNGTAASVDTVAGQGKLPLWILRPDGTVDFATAVHPPMPAPGETVVFLTTANPAATTAS